MRWIETEYGVIPEYTDEEKKQIRDRFESVGDYYVQRALDPFRETGNPLDAWRAYQTARRFGQPIPEEVLGYLDGVAQNIGKLTTDPKSRSADLARCLGMSKKGAGRGSVFTEFEERRRNRAMAIQAFFEIEDNASREGVFLDIGEKNGGLSGSTVRRIFKEYLEELERLIDRLVADGAIDFQDGKVGLRMTIEGDADDMREGAILLTLIERRMKQPPQ